MRLKGSVTRRRACPHARRGRMAQGIVNQARLDGSRVSRGLARAQSPVRPIADCAKRRAFANCPSTVRPRVPRGARGGSRERPAPNNAAHPRQRKYNTARLGRRSRGELHSEYARASSRCLALSRPGLVSSPVASATWSGQSVAVAFSRVARPNHAPALLPGHRSESRGSRARGTAPASRASSCSYRAVGGSGHLRPVRVSAARAFEAARARLARLNRATNSAIEQILPPRRPRQP